MAVLLTWQEIVANTLRSDKTIKPEVLQDAIYNVSPHETPLLSRLQQVAVKNQYVEWLTDTFRDAKTNAVLEGIAFTTNASFTVPQRASNIVQTFYEGGAISDRQRSVDHYAMDDPLLYYEGKTLIEMKKDMELALLYGTAVTGTTDVALQMNGFFNVISSVNTSSSGTTFTEQVFNDLLELVWSGAEVAPTEVYVNGRLKRTISLYSTKITPFIRAEEKKQVLVVDRYQSDFGDLDIIPHRMINKSNAVNTSGNDVLIIDPSWFATGWLEPLKREILPRDGLRVRFQLSGAFTLVYRHERGGAVGREYVAYIPSV